MSNIVVTGAAGIVGTAVARLLCERGHRVIGVDISENSREFPGTYVGGVNLITAGGARKAAATIAADGSVDGLVNIAGGFRWETISEGAPETWEHLFQINVMTTLHMSRALLPALVRSSGAIVNVGAAATLKAAAGMGAYTSSKSGVARLTEALADELKGQGVRVNSVLPSIVDTPSNRAEMGDADAAKWVSPLELAKVISFLLSSEASAVTGANILVNGRL